MVNVLLPFYTAYTLAWMAWESLGRLGCGSAAEWRLPLAGAEECRRSTGRLLNSSQVSAFGSFTVSLFHPFYLINEQCKLWIQSCFNSMVLFINWLSQKSPMGWHRRNVFGAHKYAVLRRAIEVLLAVHWSVIFPRRSLLQTFVSYVLGDCIVAVDQQGKQNRKQERLLQGNKVFIVFSFFSPLEFWPTMTLKPKTHNNDKNLFTGFVFMLNV